LHVRFILRDLDLHLTFLRKTWPRTWTCPINVDLVLTVAGLVTSLICGTTCCTTSCMTSPQQVEAMVHNKVVQQKASLTTSWTTCRTASPQQKSAASCMQQSASLTASRTTCCTTDQQLIEGMESKLYHATSADCHRVTRQEKADLEVRELVRNCSS